MAAASSSLAFRRELGSSRDNLEREESLLEGLPLALSIEDLRLLMDKLEDDLLRESRFLRSMIGDLRVPFTRVGRTKPHVIHEECMIVTRRNNEGLDIKRSGPGDC